MKTETLNAILLSSLILCILSCSRKDVAPPTEDRAKEERIEVAIRGSWYYICGKSTTGDQVAAELLRPQGTLDSKDLAQLSQLLPYFGKHLALKLLIADGRHISVTGAFFTKEQDAIERLASGETDGWSGTWSISPPPFASNSSITVRIPEQKDKPARTLRLELVAIDDTHLKIRDLANTNTNAVAVFTRFDESLRQDKARAAEDKAVLQRLTERREKELK